MKLTNHVSVSGMNKGRKPKRISRILKETDRNESTTSVIQNYIYIYMYIKYNNSNFINVLGRVAVPVSVVLDRPFHR